MSNLELTFESGEYQFSVLEFTIHEGLSTPFSVALTAVSPLDAIDFDPIIGRGAGFKLAWGDRGHARIWSGVCGHIEQIRAVSASQSTYAIGVMPSLWLLGHRQNYRIFQHVSVPDLVSSLLSEWQIDFELRVEKGAHPQLEYRVQYGESDLAFLSRMLEEAGISYYFDDAGGSSKLVLTDAPQLAQHRAEGPMPYFDVLPDGAAPEHVTDVHTGREVRSGVHRVRDYDFRAPRYPLTGAATAPRGDARLEQFVYRPGASVVEQGAAGGSVADDQGRARADEGAANDLATRRLDAIQSTGQWVRFRTSVPDLAPGVVFEMKGHPRAELVSTKGLLVTDLQLHGMADQDWTFLAHAVTADRPMRPALLTPKPRSTGVQSATVVGPKGEEIYVDESGRVRVQFPWDRVGSDDQRSSCWLRVSQGWAGAGFGMMMIPRVGQEVLVGFLDGDPDQPVVVGRLYNETERVPYPLPRYKTVSTWQSRSTPSSDGFNEIKFDDDKDHELVYVQAQRDMRKLVKHDESITVHGNRSASIGCVDSIVAGEKHEVTIAQPHDPPPTIPPTRFTMIDKKITLTTGEATIELDGPDVKIMAKGNILLSAGGGIGVVALGSGALPGPAGAPASGAVEVTSLQTMDLTALGNATLATTRELTVGSAQAMQIGAGGALTMKAAGKIAIASGGDEVQISGSPMVKINPTAALFADRVTEQVSPSPAPSSMMLPIITGAATVLIGGPSFPLPVRRVTFPDGTVGLQVGNNIYIHPDPARPDFVSEVLGTLGLISTTPDGQARLASMDAASHRLDIVYYPGPGGGVHDNSYTDYMTGDPTNPAQGSDTRIRFDPDYHLSNPSDPSHPEPVDASLYHEMTHANHAMYGQVDATNTGDNWDQVEERNTINDGSLSENDYLQQRGNQWVRTDHRNNWTTTDHRPAAVTTSPPP